MVMDLPNNVGDTGYTGFIPGLERSSGDRNGNPLQYFHVENAIDRGS